MTTIGTLLSGGECVGVGARAAGLHHLWGFELDDDIAGVARLNGFDVRTADVMDLDPATLEAPDVLHASPVCKRASQANQSAELNEDGTKEAPEDIAMGEKIASFIDVMRPRIFTLENVHAYRNFQAFRAICDTLRRNGYSFDYWHLNAADYGVAQTRKRLILVAKFGKGQRIPKPTPTHHDPGNYDPTQIFMFEPTTRPWVGWYSAILDLIPTLPESEFAAWQLARLPGEIKDSLLVDSAGYPDSDGQRVAVQGHPFEPANVIVANFERRPMRAFILDCQLAGNPETDRNVTLRQGDAPMFTVTAGKDGRQPVRAWLVGTSANDTSEAKIYREDNEPAQVVRTPGGGQIPRAWLSAGRVVRMTPRALARFQSIPDSYVLPDNNKLACTVIGNGVPCLLYRRIVEQLI